VWAVEKVRSDRECPESVGQSVILGWDGGLYSYMIIAFFRWTDFSTDAFETLLDIATSYADAAAFSIRLLLWTQPRGRRRLRFPLKCGLKKWRR
jgi:hypothetical protein